MPLLLVQRKFEKNSNRNLLKKTNLSLRFAKFPALRKAFLVLAYSLIHGIFPDESGSKSGNLPVIRDKNVLYGRTHKQVHKPRKITYFYAFKKCAKKRYTGINFIMCIVYKM